MLFTQNDIDNYYATVSATETKKTTISHNHKNYDVSVTSDLDYKTIDFVDASDSNIVYGYVNEKGEWKEV